MSGDVRYDRNNAMSKLRDNALRETTSKRELVCGHFTGSQPLATTFGRKLYWCEACRALRKAKGR